MISERLKDRYYDTLDALDREIKNIEAVIPGTDGEDTRRLETSLANAKEESIEIRNRLSQKPMLGECACCHHEAAIVTWYEQSKAVRDRDDPDGYWFCKLCAGTMAGNTVIYPNQYGLQHTDILQAMSFIGNEILAAMRTGIHTREAIAESIIDEPTGRLSK